VDIHLSPSADVLCRDLEEGSGTNMSSHSVTTQPVRRIEPWVLAGFVVAAVAAEVLAPRAPTAVRVLVGAVLVLAVGGGLSFVVFPRGRVGGAERVLSAFALALTALIVVSFVLYLSPWRLSTRSWALALGVVGVTACLVSEVGHRRAGRSPHPARITPRRPAWSTLDVAACVGMVVVLALVVVLARRPLAPPEGVGGYTQLWLVPDASGAELGVASFELERTSYHLELVSGQTVVQMWDFELAPNERWTVEAPPVPGVVQARLYRNGDAAVYRRVSGQVMAPSGAGSG
jgi:hypothetical protein